MAEGPVIQPLEGKTFGAVVTGVRLGSLSEHEWLVIERAFNELSLLIFPGQSLTDDEQVAFAKRFGACEFEKSPMDNYIRRHNTVRPFPQHSDMMQLLLGNEFWHADSTYQPVAAKAGMLSARVVPPLGGGTEFADMRAAYDALQPTLRERLGGLRAYHSNEYSQANDLGHFPTKAPWNARIYHGSAYLRPLLNVHPVTGRRSLAVGRHAFGVQGLPREESRRLLAELLSEATGAEDRRYEHRWREGDLVLWDNRCLLHRARPYDHQGQRRLLLGTRILGDPTTEGALPGGQDEEAGKDEEAGVHALRAELCVLQGLKCRAAL